MFHKNRGEISEERERYLQKMRVEKYGINAARFCKVDVLQDKVHGDTDFRAGKAALLLRHEIRFSEDEAARGSRFKR